MKQLDIETSIIALHADAVTSDPGNRKAGEAYRLAQQAGEQTGESALAVIERLTGHKAAA